MNYLENQLNQLIKHVNSSNLGFGWKNNADRNHQGTYLGGEVFDYIIINKNGVYCFDAKETVLSKWNIRDKDIKQGANLFKTGNSNRQCFCFFVIYYKKLNKLRKLNIQTFSNILAERMYVRPEDCDEEFNYRKMFL